VAFSGIRHNHSTVWTVLCLLELQGAAMLVSIKDMNHILTAGCRFGWEPLLILNWPQLVWIQGYTKMQMRSTVKCGKNKIMHRLLVSH